MSTIEKSVEIGMPVRKVYNQWTQFEDYPEFMEGVESVRQLDDQHLAWKAEIAGKTKQWKAEITEQIPDKRIAWTNVDGAKNAGVVTFHRLSDDATRVMLQMDYDPEGLAENVGDFLGAMDRRVEGDLKRFKRFLEERGGETGAYRGQIPSPDERV